MYTALNRPKVLPTLVGSGNYKQVLNLKLPSLLSITSTKQYKNYDVHICSNFETIGAILPPFKLSEQNPAVPKLTDMMVTHS